MHFLSSKDRNNLKFRATLAVSGLFMAALVACNPIGNLTTLAPPPSLDTAQRPAAQPSAPAKAPVHFAYSGEAGPEKWATLAPEFEKCGSGQLQSPINIKHEALPPIQFDYKDTPLKIVNNGHTIQVNYAPGSKITVGDHSYELLQFHFHTPSENTLDGKAFAMELHLVHKDAAGKLGVVGVFLEEGSENATLKTIMSNLPKEENKEETVSGVMLNAGTFLPQTRDYYGFDGSLTTPPCSEGVDWRVLNTPVQVSKAQVEVFAEMFHGGNARPVQPLNNRNVQFSD
ncbi:MAG TPA: carbonic anhydrase family protein [Candidatus Obscuribacterales bacterium]